MGQKRKIQGKQFPYKKYKQESGKLVIGKRGVLITNSLRRRHKEAMQEALTILRSYAELHCESEVESNEKAKEIDVFKELDKEINAVKRDFDRFVPGPCISQGLNLVFFNSKSDLPSVVIRGVFGQILSNAAFSARYLCRMVPIDMVCKATLDELGEALKILVSRHFDKSTAASLVAGETVKEALDKPLGTWALAYTSRNSDALKRQQVLDLVTGLVGNNYRVDLKTPQQLIVVEVVKCCCGLAVIGEYSEIAKFGLNVSKAVGLVNQLTK